MLFVAGTPDALAGLHRSPSAPTPAPSPAPPSPAHPTAAQSDAGLPRPVEGSAEHGLPDHPGTWSAPPRRPLRRRPRRGRAKWGFLPFAHTDFIFAIIAEELGLFGAAHGDPAVPRLRRARGRTAIQAPDRFGMLLAIGITAWILVQAVREHRWVVGVLPITGVPLPVRLLWRLVDGRATMVAVGLLLNMARQSARPIRDHTAGARRRYRPLITTASMPLRRRRHRRATCCPASRSPGAGRPRSPAAAIHFVGSERGIEGAWCRGRASRLTCCPGAASSGASPSPTLARRGPHRAACSQAFGVVRRRGPAVVVALGGYASVACALAAILWRVPIVVAEQNARAGAATAWPAVSPRPARSPSPAPTCRGRWSPATRSAPDLRRSTADRTAARARDALGSARRPQSCSRCSAARSGSRRINEAMLGASTSGPIAPTSRSAT